MVIVLALVMIQCKCNQTPKGGTDMAGKDMIPAAFAGKVIADLTQTHGKKVAARIEKGVNQAAGLWRKSDGAYIGGSGLHRIDWSVPCVEIGYWLRT